MGFVEKNDIYSGLKNDHKFFKTGVRYMATSGSFVI
jgi:hypothetical protein